MRDRKLMRISLRMNDVIVTCTSYVAQFAASIFLGSDSLMLSYGAKILA